MKKLLKSIELNNLIIFLSAIYFNILFYIYDSLKWDHLIFFLSVNLVLIVSYFIVNRKYDNELLLHKNDINELIKQNSNNENKDYINSLLQNKNQFLENKNNYKLFQRMFIKKNILKKDYEDLRKTFFKFIPEWFMQKVWDIWAERISLWLSSKQYIHVLFLDIIWFTWLTEDLEPRKTLLLLNIYFDEIVNIIQKNWWCVDKFLWDGLMAVFSEKNSDNTIRSSIEIQNFVSKVAISDIWKKISVSIWINSWDATFWTIWSKDRMQITIVWDTVNTASRIENITRKYKESIIISENTLENIKNKEEFSIIDLWEEEIIWRKNKVKIYWIKNVINYKLKKYN